MKRIVLLAVSLWMPFMSCLCAQDIASPLPMAVGALGDPSRLEFEGISTFSAQEIRRSLMRCPDFLLASHSAASFRQYLLAVERLIQAGFQQSGFKDAQAAVAIDKTREKIVVTVSEGPRYVFGDIEVLGATTLPVESFVRRMTERRVKTTESEETETEDPIWQQGKPAAFSQGSLDKLIRDIKSVLAELGYYFCTFTVDVVTTPGVSSARLVVRIEEEGSRTISKIIITGNQKNTRAQILDYLGLKEGMLLDRALISNVEDRLWRAARFLGYSVTPQADAASEVIRLRINVREYEPAPTLSETFSPEETLLLKSCDWLSGFQHGQDDLMVTLDIKELNLALQIVVSPIQGILGVARTQTGAQAGRIVNAAMVTPENISLFSPTCKTRFVLPELSAQILASLALVPNPDSTETKLFMIRPGIAIKNNRLGGQYHLDVKLAPVCFLSFAHREGIDLTELLDKGIVNFAGDSGYQVILDTESGRLNQVTTPQDANTPFVLTMALGLFDRARNTLEQAASDHAQAFVPQRPVGSLVQYVAALPLFHTVLVQRSGTLSDIPLDDLARGASVAGEVLGQTVAPFDEWVVKRRGRDQDHFKLSPQDMKTMKSPMSMVASMFAAFVFEISNELFPPESWPWTLSRETVFVAGGMGKYTGMELRRLYQSPQTGPIGFLAAAKLLTYVNQPLSRTFAAKGLKQLSVRDFQNDWRLIVEEDHLLSECLNLLSQALQDLDEQDLHAILALCSPAQAQFIRDIVRGIHEKETKSIEQVLAPVLERYWQNELKPEVEKKLRMLATPTTN